MRAGDPSTTETGSAKLGYAADDLSQNVGTPAGVLKLPRRRRGNSWSKERSSQQSPRVSVVRVTVSRRLVIRLPPLLLPRTLRAPQPFQNGYPPTTRSIDTKWPEICIWVDRRPDRVSYYPAAPSGCTPDEVQRKQIKCPVTAAARTARRQLRGPAAPDDRAHVELAPDGQIVSTCAPLPVAKGQPA